MLSQNQIRAQRRRFAGVIRETDQSMAAAGQAVKAWLKKVDADLSEEEGSASRAGSPATDGEEYSTPDQQTAPVTAQEPLTGNKEGQERGDSVTNPPTAAAHRDATSEGTRAAHRADPVPGNGQVVDPAQTATSGSASQGRKALLY